MRVHYSRAIPPAPPYSEWNMMRTSEGKLMPDYVPDMERPEASGPWMRWTAQAFLEPGGRGVTGAALPFGALCLLMVMSGLFSLVLVRDWAWTLLFILVTAVTLGFGIALRVAAREEREPQSGSSWLTIGGAVELRGVEEAIRAALADAELSVLQENKRGWGEGWQWTLDLPIRMQLRRDIPETPRTYTLFVRTRGKAHLQTHQALKGRILEALRARGHGGEDGAVAKVMARVAGE